jgi:hypothetical protein
MRHEGGNNNCAWMSISRELVRAGRAVALFRYTPTGTADARAGVDGHGHACPPRAGAVRVTKPDN